jgi:hypothetical protein
MAESRPYGSLTQPDEDDE